MSHSTAIAAAAIGISTRQLSNLIARVGRRLVAIGAQGRARKIPQTVLEQVAVALLLQRDLGSPVERSLQLAAHLIASPEHELPLGALMTIRFDIPRLRTVLQRSLAAAVEDCPPARRGRPRTAVSRKGRGVSA